MTKPHHNVGNKYAAVENPKKAFQVMAKEDEIKLFGEAADKENKSRSEWIVEQCLKSLNKESK